MRNLTMAEVDFVSGGEDSCSAGNSYGGINDTSSVADEMIALYEAAVETASYIIERVANAL